MNEEFELALAYWRTMAPQPKAIIYANAIEAKLKGVDTKEMVIDHELSNAITRGAFIARSRGMQTGTMKLEQKAEAVTQPIGMTVEQKPRIKGSRRAKDTGEASTHPLKS